jgi:hypothetical protein
MPQLHASPATRSPPPNGKGKAKASGARFSITSHAGSRYEDGETSIIGELAELGGVWGAMQGSMAKEKTYEDGREAGEKGGLVGEGTRLIDWSVACRYLAAQCMVIVDD